jgi:hypothetical protein
VLINGGPAAIALREQKASMIKIMAVIDPVFRRVVFIFYSLLNDKFDKNYS